jgi:hypothetical protein
MAVPVRCYNCGADVPPSERHCDMCGANMAPHDEPRVEEPVASPFVPETPVAAPGPTLPGSPIRLCDGEQLLRRYDAVRLRSRKRGEGTLYVTDARIVFFARTTGRGNQASSRLIQQTRLQDVAGLQAFVVRQTSLALLALTSWLGLIGIISLVFGRPKAGLILLLLAGVGVAIILAGSAQRGQAGVMIQSRDADYSPIRFGSFRNRRGWFDAILGFVIFPLVLFLRAQTAFDVLFGRPGEDSDRLIAELGALILDLQTRGTLAAEYWKSTAGDALSRSRATG